MTNYFFEEPARDDALIANNKQLRKLSDDERTELLRATHQALASLDNWIADNIQTALNQLLETTGQKPGILFSLIRIVVTWAPFSPQLNDTLALLGRDRTLARIDAYLAA